MGRKDVDPKILELCDKVTAKRARTVIDHIIKHGQITTEELQEIYGYDHPPRAARDVRENGVPLKTRRISSNRTGRQIGVYEFDDPSKIKKGRIGGRSAFSKRFREALLDKYGSADAVTGIRMDSRYLQIDHRIPYEVVGDIDFNEDNLEDYMLLDASSQRAKSWSCEHCKNWIDIHDPEVCATWYWAYPDNYNHIAMDSVRRLDIVWTGDETDVFERLRRVADREGVYVTDLVKDLLDKASRKT